MTETINWSFSVAVDKGPRLTGFAPESVDAYDKASVVLPAGGAAVTVELQPTATADRVSLVLVAASVYTGGVTYSADGGATKFELDGPLLLIGTGAVKLLADAPQTLSFENPSANDVTVDILVGRDATV